MAQMLLSGTLLALQIASKGEPRHTERAAAPPVAIAAAATTPPVIDGLDTDDVWQTAQRITEFREFQPTEDKDLRFATEARVAYDAHNFYVFVRMFDPSPDSILRLMARRDVSRDPRADRYDDRFRPYADPVVQANPGGFTVKQFRSNVVLRWEYRPGSTLFRVWNQGRQGFDAAAGDRSLARDLGDVFDLRADNTFLVKASYWLNW